MPEDYSIMEPHFIFDGPRNPDEGVVVTVLYCYLNTPNPMVTFAAQPTMNTKIEIYE